MRIANNYKGKKIIGISAFVMLILILFSVILSIPIKEDAVAAQPEQFDFYIKTKLGGYEQVPLADISTVLRGSTTKFLDIDIYASAKNAASYSAAVITGSLWYDKTIFTINAVNGVDSALRYDDDAGDDVADWDTTSYGVFEGRPISQIGLVTMDSFKGNVLIEKDQLLCTVKLKVIDADKLAVTNSEIVFNFDSTHNEGQTHIARLEGGSDYYYYYNSVDSSDWSNITCTPLYLGDLPGSEPTADLTQLSLKDNKGGQIEYVAETFDPETIAYTTWTISYADSVNGMALSYAKASSSSVASISFSATSVATIDENHIITGLANGDEIIISLSDNDGAITKTYTITCSVTPISTNANLNSLSAKTGATNVNFVEEFDPDTLNYILNIPFSKNAVTLTAIKADSLATLKIDNELVSSKTFTALPVGTTNKTIQVTAEDGTIKNYTVAIVRAAASTNTDLAGIKVNNNDVEMGVGLTSFQYTIAESTGTYLFSLIAQEPSLQKLEYSIEGAAYVQMQSGGTSGTARGIAKNQTVNVSIRVTAEDTAVTKIYELHIKRAASTNTQLESLQVQSEDTLKTLTATANVYSYDIVAGSNQITVIASPKLGEGGTARILDPQGQEVVGGIIDISAFAAGTYAYSVEVTPQDTSADSKTYTLNIVKKSSAKELNFPTITHTDNSGAEITGIIYDEYTSTYTLFIPYAINNVVVDKIQMVFTASANSTISCVEWANLTQGTSPGGGVPLSYANHTFNTVARAEIFRDIVVTAEDKSTKIFHIRFTRQAADTDNYLSSLSVAGTAVDGFVKTTQNYTNVIIFEGSTESVNVFGETVSANAKVTYNGESSGQIILTRGVIITVNIVVEAQSGATRMYTIKVVAANNDNTITNIELQKTDSSTIPGLPFDASNIGPYNVTVPFTQEVIILKVTTPTGANSIVTGGGTKTLSVGNNQFEIFATSEAGTKGKVYTINITRNAARTEKILETLTISSAGSTPVANYITTFSSSTYAYNIRVDRDVASLKVEGTVPVDNGSKITAGLTESFTWATGSATITVEVTAENGTKQNYTISVTRANDNNQINDIDVDVQTIDFSDATINYNLNPVAFSQDKLTFSVVLDDAIYAKLFVKVNSGSEMQQASPDSFTVNLATGSNTISIYAKSDFGTPGTIYKFNITRNVASTNANLSALSVKAAGDELLVGDKQFFADTTLYELRVNNTVTSFTINASTEFEKATYSISPTGTTLNLGDNTFTITVKAEDNLTTKEYVVKIKRANDENEITNIQVAGQTFTYNKDTLSYTLTAVGYSTTYNTYNVTLLDPSAKVWVKINDGAYKLETVPADFNTSLVVGANIIKIYAVSEYGTQGQIYTFTIVRNAPSTNAKLSALTATCGGTNRLDGIFDPDTTLYQFRVDNNVPTVTILATTQDNKASVTITPANFNLNSGLNVYYVTVTAEDTTTKATYQVEITKQNDVNDIEDIQVDSKIVNFDPENLNYSLGEVEFSVASLNFGVTLKDSTAKLYVKVNTSAARVVEQPVDFDLTLASGENTILIYAVSEYGTKGAEYKFTVTKKIPSNNSKLSLLEVLAQSEDILKGDNAFSQDKTSYTLRVDNTVNNIAINATAQDSKATISYTPSDFRLNSGSNTFYVLVTAEDTTTKTTYTINITKANDNNTILDIDNDIEDVAFENSTTNYALQNVAFSVKNITFNVTLEDVSAKLYSRVNGTTKLQTTPASFSVALVAGANTIVIYAVSEFNTKGQEYTFSVTQNPANTDTTLSQLTAVVGGLNILIGDNAFDKDIKEYNVRVNNNLSNINITAIPTFEFATVTITPTTNSIAVGKNVFHIQVKAESGAQETYTLNVYRANDNNIITKIVVGTIEIDLTKPNPITIPSFSYSTNSITITAEREDASATVYGTGLKNLVDGKQYFEVYAISQYGLLAGVTKDDVKVYMLEVERIPVQTDKTLDSLKVTDGDGTTLAFDNGIEFDKLRTSYTITLDVNSLVTEIIINATAVINSKVLSGHTGRHSLTVKENGTISDQFVLTVTAQNGIMQNYTINIVKGTSLSSDTSIHSVQAKDADNNEYMSFNPNLAKQSDINIPYKVAGLTLTVTPNDPKATVSGTTGYIPVNAGGFSYVQFKIVAQDGTESTYTYNFNIIRAAAKTENHLQTLTIKDVNDSAIDFMDGIFNASVTTYDIRVDDNVESVVVNANVPSGNGSKIISTIKPSYALTSGAVTSIIIIVQAENGDSNIYTINVKRANNDNAIASITIGGTVVPVASFTKVGASYEYTVTPNVINKVTTMEIAATLANPDSKATVTGAGIKNLNEGLNSFIVYATAQDGTVGANYVVRVTREVPSSDATLKNLKISINEGTPLIDTTTVLNSYDLLLGRDTTTITIEATKNHQGASISGDLGTFDVTGGIVNKFKIYVTAENGTSKTYTINVDIKDGKNGITLISTETATLNFIDTTVSYDLGTVAYSVDEIDFSVSLDSEYSKLYLNSALVSDINAIKASLAVGKNTFTFYALSESGNKGTHYLITINRTAANTNNYLSSLVVKDGNENVLAFKDGVFNRAVQNYTITLNANSTATYVVIFAVAENGSTPTGTGVRTLTSVGGVISNDFTVSVTAENGEERDYVVTVVKSQQVEESTDFDITDISLIGKGKEYLKTIFQKEFAEQDPITVPYDVDSVYLSITANSKATVTGGGLYSIAEGETRTINFQVTAQNGTKGLFYSLYVTREIAETENELQDLYIEINGEREYLNPLLDSFTINVNNDTASIVIGGVAPDSATVTGFGTFDLINNTTSKVVSVKAQNGETKTYVITIVKQSDDATIKSIQLDGEEILSAFSGNLYTKTVAYSKDRVAILATSTDTKATITGNGSFNLDVGVNKFVVYATSEAGSKGTEYTIRITRQTADTNNNLGNLIVLDNASGNSLLLQPVFDSSVTKYTVDLTEFPAVNEILISAASQSAKAKSVEGTGVFTLKTALGESSEIFSVTVTAENGSKKVYDVTVIRNVKPEDDISVNTVSFVGSDGINYLGTAPDALTKFELGTKKYTVTIPYSVDNANLTIINNNGATVYGNGNYVLNSDKIVEFRIISQSGNYTSDTYVIEVMKELPSSDNTLSSLTVDGVLIEGFDPEITSYEMTVSFEDISFIQIAATASCDKAKVIGDLGRINLSSGINTINIKVTAEDGSSNTYSVVVSRLSKDNTLLDLGVENYTITPKFDVNVVNYTLEVPFTVPTVNVLATSNTKATITGIGHKVLKVGQNIIEVYVTSEQGIKGDTYTLVVTKTAASSDNTLKSLDVFSGVDGQAIALQPAFRPDVNDYIIELGTGSNINTLNITAEANCPLASGVGGTGYKVLKTTLDGLYNNVFEVTVMAQDLTTRTYTISVYRDVELADDITIGELSLKGSDGVNYLGNNGAITAFLPSIYSYNIVVPYYVESITLQVQTLTATCYGAGQKMFDASNRLTFTTYLVSQSGAVVSNNYNIIVNRTMPKNDNTLKSIRVNGVQVKNFDPAIEMYEIDIPYLTTQKIIISAEPTSPTADIINGIGTFNLAEGRNVFSILVRAENGDTRSYNLVVNYMNTNSLLDSLSLEGSIDSYVDDNNAIAYPFTFIPDTLSYVVTVDKSIKTVNLKGQAQDQNRAAIIGLGKYTLNNDRTTIVVNVIAADNETTSTYTVNIIKTVLPSSNTRLKDLSIDGYNLAFNPTERDYSLNVNSDTGILDINAIPEDPNAKVSIVGNTRLESGQNVVLVQVEAEDGTKSFYQLKVNKPIEQDYFLTIMLILIFLLLLIVLLTKLISSNKDKNPRRNFKGFKLNNNNDPIDLNNIGEETKKWKTS